MFYVDIEDAAGNRLGSGPITSASQWKVRRALDAAGTWSFVAPMADVKMAEAQPRRYAHIYAFILSGYQWVGGGPIDSIVTAIDANGIVQATVSGSDLLRELVWRSVGSVQLADGSGNPISHAAAVAAVMALAPAGWTATADPAPGWDLVYGQFGGETVLAALAKVAERSRTHYYLSGRRALTLGSAFTASGVRCVAASQALGQGQAAITALSVERSSYDLLSRIIPIGSGQSKVALTLRATGRAAPAGYTLNKSSNHLSNDAVETAYGRCERVVAFKDIAPLSSTDADVISASNALFDAALYWLQQHSAPISAYRLTVAECPQLLLPLQTVHVYWRDPDQQTTIDADLYITGVEWAGGVDGVRTSALTVADAPYQPADDVSAVVDSITSATIYQALPQLSANSYVIPYSKNVDDALEANFRFRFDEDVTQLVRVVFDFQLLPLESTVKAVGADSVTTSSGGSSTPTTASGGGATPTTSSGGSSTPTTTSGGGATPTTSTQAQTTPTTTSGGGATVTSASGDKSHLHSIPILNGSSGAAVYYSGGQLYASTGSSTSVNSNFANVSHSHDVTVAAHSHDVTIAAHSHSVTIAAHSHDVTIAAHSHTVTIAAHSHSVTIAAHDHTVTPVINTTYGIFRDVVGNVFALADLEYQVNSGSWYAFTAGVNGFASLGSSWYRVDLTALLQDSTTLRPLASNNLLTIRKKTTGAAKKATIDAQMNIRNIIQALALN